MPEPEHHHDDGDHGDWYDEVSFPALLRAARSTYGEAIRSALAEAGCTDVPPSGSFVLGAIAREGAQLGWILRTLGVSKQTGGQLVDTLVIRGYLDRSPDPDDRRRLRVGLTERGAMAAAVGRSAVERVDAELAERVGPEGVALTRRTLGALAGLSRAGGR